MTFHFTYARDSGEFILAVNYTNPSTGVPFDDNEVTAVDFRVLDPSTTPATVLLSTTSGVFDTVLQMWKLSWTFASSLDGVRYVVVEAVPTRTSSVAAALWPETRIPVNVDDAMERQDEIDDRITSSDLDIKLQ